MLMRVLPFIAVFAAAVSLNGCSGPTYFWIINATSRVLTITSATHDGMGGGNVANASPWFWPWRSDPVLDPGEAQRLTAYCYSCSPSWSLSVRVGVCDVEIAVPPPPSNAYEREDWQLMLAYPDAMVQISEDLLVYRVPAYAGRTVNTDFIRQPEGYPLVADRVANCENEPFPEAPV